MDLLQGVQDGLQENGDVLDPDIAPAVGSDVASLEKLLKIVKKLNLSIENEEQLKEVLKKKAERGMLGGFMPESLKNIGDVGKDSDEYDGPIILLYLLILVSFVLIVLAFFGYKLYKSHVERERKREEKRRLKQQKKKK
ncbi:uncharacterized protein LOC123307960 isoform X1 [Coccinella septempunctata]|uniref:uncharacterized protein LOC123307960 isoform X1 n=1 Tax=Coccinella septempunctata TaxID=41139 RepID=UPI001D073901|nr:uncharacterized protein LOC123307960 isoform X1 [Coccinella septempunctata]